MMYLKWLNSHDERFYNIEFLSFFVLSHDLPCNAHLAFSLTLQNLIGEWLSKDSGYFRYVHV
jgi:hypothetical protein